MTDVQQAVPVVQEYRKTATIRASQWWQLGDHPSVYLREALGDLAHHGKPVPWCPTLEGGHVVTPGDWIATGVQGEHWPIKPDVFATTYAPVDASLPCKSGEGAGQAWMNNPLSLDAGLPETREAELVAAAQAVVDDYPVAAGKYPSLEGADNKPGYGSIRRLAAALNARGGA